MDAEKTIVSGVKIYEKFNCSQAVLGAYADDYGLTVAQAMKVAACFSGGVRKGEVCGAVSGAIMVIGLKYGERKECFIYLQGYTWL